MRFTRKFLNRRKILRNTMRLESPVNGSLEYEPSPCLINTKSSFTQRQNQPAKVSSRLLSAMEKRLRSPMSCPSTLTLRHCNGIAKRSSANFVIPFRKDLRFDNQHSLNRKNYTWTAPMDIFANTGTLIAAFHFKDHPACGGASVSSDDHEALRVNLSFETCDRVPRY